LADELYDRAYLVVDAVDGRAHYVALPAHAKLSDYPTGSIVTVRAGADPRPADRIIAALAENGIYRTERHLAEARTRERNPEGFVQAHVRRLEALRRAGIVERVADGVWRVPPDLIERGRAYDARHAQGALVDIRSELPIERQVRAMGVTWLDRQLVGGPEVLSPQGFGAQVRQALVERGNFLVEQGFATRRGQRLILMRDLLATLRAREIETVARGIEAETGLIHRPTSNGSTVSGVYRRSVSLVSGRFAMLDDGLGFSLVPWRRVIDPHLGQSISAVVRGDSVSWELGRSRGLSP